MKCRLIAIDVDGTLVDSNQIVAPETIEALHYAQNAGVGVCIATGRSLVETMPVWKQLRLDPPYLPMVVIGGAMVCEVDTRRTLYHRPIELDVAHELDSTLGEAGFASLAFVDRWRHGTDYYLGENGDGESAMKLWFSKMNVRVRRGKSLRAMTDMPTPLRINAVAPVDKAASLAQLLRERFEGRLNIHSLLAPNYGVHVVEAFHPKADKFRAVTYIAQGLRIPASAIAAIGDDVNDIPMIANAGIGATFPTAPKEVRSRANHVITDGLGSFIRQVIDGKIAPSKPR